MADQSKPRVVEAVGVASASQVGNDDLAARIEAAMQRAIRECLDEGVTDTAVQRERISAAREAVLAE